MAWVRLRSTRGHWLAHPDLRSRMIADAAKLETNLSDVANRILSGFFGVPYTGIREASEPKQDDDKIHFKVTPSLQAAIQRAYPNRKWTDSIREVLCRHYGLTVPPPVKLTRAAVA